MTAPKRRAAGGATKHEVLNVAGQTVLVNASDLVDARCSDCRRSRDETELRVSFIAQIPPRGRAYWRCAGGCPA